MIAFLYPLCDTSPHTHVRALVEFPMSMNLPHDFASIALRALWHDMLLPLLE